MKKVLIVTVAVLAYFGYRVYEVNSFKSIMDETKDVSDPSDPDIVVSPIEPIVEEEELEAFISFEGCVNYFQDIKIKEGETIEEVVDRNEGILGEYYSLLEYNKIKNQVVLDKEVVNIECKSKINVIGCVEEIEIYFEEGDRLIDYEEDLKLNDICSVIEYNIIKYDYLKDGKNIILEEKIKIYLEGCINEIMYIEKGENIFLKLMERGEVFLCDYGVIKEETNEFVTKDSFYYLTPKGEVVFETQKSTFNIYFSKGDKIGDLTEYIISESKCNVAFRNNLDEEFVAGTVYSVNCIIFVTLKGDVKGFCNVIETSWGNKVGETYFFMALEFCYGPEIKNADIDLEERMYENHVLEIYL